jgi:hypothetical protein
MNRSDETTQATEIATRAEPDDVQRLMAVAIEQGEAGVAALERLVAMRERAEDRSAQRAHADAIARFQELCPVIAKNASGAHNARYATLDQILDQIRPALTQCGLSVTYDSEELPDGRLRVLAIVRHSHGHAERASFVVSREKAGNRMNATQADGSALSYARRYALCMALGIATGERDDDGAGAGSDAEPRITQQQAADLRALAEEVGADLPRFLRWMGAQSFDNIAASRHAKAVAALEAKRAPA